MVNVSIQKLENFPENFDLPSRGTVDSVGYDLRSVEDIYVIDPGGKKLFKCGIALSLPRGVECQIRPRSGLATKKLLIIPNAPGTIDPDYRGEVMVCLYNIGNRPQYVEHGERIAQMVFSKYEDVEWTQVESLEETERGQGGFGSTGSV